MTRYLLGELPESEAAELEYRYFTNEAAFERLAQYETDLIDDYARGWLSAEVRQRFERVYSANPERRARLQFGKVLVARVDSETSSIAVDPKANTPSRLQKFFAPLFVDQKAFAFTMALLVLLLICGSVWLFLKTSRLRNELAQLRATQAAREQHERELQQQLTAEQNRSQQLTAELERERAQTSPQTGVEPPKTFLPAFVSLLLVAPSVRSGQIKSQTLTIPAGTQEVHIQLRTGENEYRGYQLELYSVGGPSIFNNQNAKPSSNKSGATFRFSLPASKFASGDYILTLRGVTQSGDVEDVSKSLFLVQKK